MFPNDLGTVTPLLFMPRKIKLGIAMPSLGNTANELLVKSKLTNVDDVQMLFDIRMILLPYKSNDVNSGHLLVSTSNACRRLLNISKYDTFVSFSISSGNRCKGPFLISIFRKAVIVVNVLGNIEALWFSK